MNAKIPATLVALASLLAVAQDAPSPPPPAQAAAQPAQAPAQPAPAVTEPASPSTTPRPQAAPPIVRLPISDTPAPAPSGLGLSGPGLPTANSQLGWSSDGVGLRTPASTLRTNRPIEFRGAVPRLIRPQRRTFGGFITGFANLLNPFAPVEQGVGSPQGNWYDGRNNVAPLPRGFRDERSHEPSALIFSTPLGRDPVPDPDPAPAPRATPIPVP